MSQSEIISDEMRKFINLKTKPKIYNVDRHSVERFAEAIGDDNPIYFNIYSLFLMIFQLFLDLERCL